MYIYIIDVYCLIIINLYFQQHKQFSLYIMIIHREPTLQHYKKTFMLNIITLKIIRKVQKIFDKNDTIRQKIVHKNIENR